RSPRADLAVPRGGADHRRDRDAGVRRGQQEPGQAPPQARRRAWLIAAAELAALSTTPSAATVASRAPRAVPPVLARQVRQVLSSLRFRGCGPIRLALLGLARRRGE